MGPNDGAGAAPTPSEPSLLNDLQGMESGLDGGSSNPLLEESGAGMAGGAGQGNLFKFAGREYPNQAEAEKHWSKLYGQYSEQKGVVNTVKEALKDPELLEALAQDPKWAGIFAKLGIETDTRDVRNERGQQGPEQNQEMHEWRVEREVDRLEREEYRFERELGRALNPEERTATLRIISRANSLSFKEAWQLANHEKLLKEASSRAAGTAQPGVRKPGVQRPAPPPSSVPGTSVNSKKPVHKMSASEWKENLRNDPDIRELLSR
jgi:hypothetical protein